MSKNSHFNIKMLGKIGNFVFFTIGTKLGACTNRKKQHKILVDVVKLVIRPRSETYEKCELRFSLQIPKAIRADIEEIDAIVCAKYIIWNKPVKGSVKAEFSIENRIRCHKSRAGCIRVRQKTSFVEDF